MTRLLVFIALLIQGTLINCQDEEQVLNVQMPIEHETEPLEIIRLKPEIDQETKNEFFKTFFGDSFSLYPSSSVALMTQATDNEKSPEEQIKDMKETATKITTMIQSEIANLLSFAIGATDGGIENELRSKRSVETPMASTEMVMRLLKHIKYNNDCQNLAIEKMMSAQEIAEKFGIDFNPDEEILTDFALAANKQTEELTDIIKDACDHTLNKTVVSFVPLQDANDAESVQKETNITSDNPYYTYSVDPHAAFSSAHIQELTPEHISRPVRNHHHHQQHHHHNMETQIVPPPQPHHHCNPPVSQKPAFYEDPTQMKPVTDFYPEYCSVEIEPLIIFEEYLEPEPELVGEVFEETMTSKVFINHGDESGETTVNHVMTYTVSESASFRPPQIQNLPQQMQYSFFLM